MKEREKGGGRESVWEEGREGRRDRETETGREKQKGWEGKRGRREKLSKPILFLLTPLTQILQCASLYCYVSALAWWITWGLNFPPRLPRSGWEDLYKSYPYLLKSTFIAMKVSVSTRYRCLQTDLSIGESLQGCDWRWPPRQVGGKWRGTTVESNSGTFKEVRLGRRCLRREQMRQQQEATGLGTFHPWLPGLSPPDIRKRVQPALRNCFTLTVTK